MWLSLMESFLSIQSKNIDLFLKLTKLTKLNLPTTDAPLDANSNAYSRPKPPPAPVTTATRPANERRLDAILYQNNLENF